MGYARTVSVLIAFGGWVTLALGVLRLQALAHERFRSEPPPNLPRTYRGGVGALFRRVQQGRGTELSDETRAFAERTGRGAEYERARLFVRWGVAIMGHVRDDGRRARLTGTASGSPPPDGVAAQMKG